MRPPLQAQVPQLTEETLKLVEETLELVEETLEPVEETLKPVEGSFQPAEETLEPVEETLEPVEETLEPVEETLEPVEDTVGLELRIAEFSFCDRLEPMKTTIDIPEDLLADAMRFTGAKTKREAVVKAMEDFNRARKVEALLKLAGSIPNFPTNDEIEAGDLAREKRLDALWNR
jgi:vacuolar-type H+-ATPase subunit I/STV1